MTFDQLVSEVKDRLNLTSTDATTRIGKAINRKYKLVTSTIGLELSKRATVQVNATIGSPLFVVPNCEKVVRVANNNVSPYRVIPEVSLHELTDGHSPFTSSSTASAWAAYTHTSNTVTVMVNSNALTAYALTFEIQQVLTDLSGTNEPAFPESYCEVLVEGVLADELRKMEKPALAQIAQSEYERILSDLRMWIAKSCYTDVYQGKTGLTFGPGIGGGGGSGSSGDAASLLSGTLPVARLAAGTTTYITNTSVGTQNNFAPAGLSGDTVIRLTGVSDVTITGLAGGVVGQVVTFVVTSGSTIVASFPHQSASSSVGNKFYNMLTSIATPITNGGYISFIYDSANWVLIDHNQGGSVFFTPVWGNTGTANTLGNGTIVMSYILTGRICDFWVNLTFGTTTTSGNGLWTFNYPFTLALTTPDLSGFIYDLSAGTQFKASGLANSSTVYAPAYLAIVAAIALSANISATAPMTWTTGDVLSITGHYVLI